MTTLPESDFALSVIEKGSGWCKPCRSAYDKEKRLNNPKYFKDRDKEYYENNKDDIIERQKEYNKSDSHKEYQKEYNKKYYIKKKGT